MRHQQVPESRIPTKPKFFLIPNSDYIKSTVVGNEFMSVWDLKEGFNQVDTEEETRKKMLVLPQEAVGSPGDSPSARRMVQRSSRNWSSLFSKGDCTKIGFRL